MRRRHLRSVPRLPEAGEIVTVRAYAGSRAAEEPRAIVIDGVETPIEEVCWRASVAEGGHRYRAFVVRVAGARLRLVYDEDSALWVVQRRLPG